jgi:hypothetical protein
MNKIIVCLLCIFFYVPSFCQTISHSLLTRKDYEEKSKKQLTSSLITGIPGVTLITIGGIMYMSEFGNGLQPGDQGFDNDKFHTGEALMIAGALLSATAIPFMVASRRNKRMATTILSLKNEPATKVQKGSFIAVCTPSLSLKITL